MQHREFTHPQSFSPTLTILFPSLFLPHFIIPPLSSYLPHSPTASCFSISSLLSNTFPLHFSFHYFAEEHLSDPLFLSLFIFIICISSKTIHVRSYFSFLISASWLSYLASVVSQKRVTLPSHYILISNLLSFIRPNAQKHISRKTNSILLRHSLCYNVTFISSSLTPFLPRTKGRYTCDSVKYITFPSFFCPIY